MHVQRLSMAAVKGTRLRTVDELDLDIGGAVGDRRFFIVDDRGRMINGKTVGELSRVIASCSGDRLRLEFPDRPAVEDNVHVSGRLSVLFYCHPVETQLVGGHFSEALSAYVGRELRLVSGGAGLDRGRAGAVTLMSRGSLERLAAEAGEVAVDGRRFRMTVEVDGLEAHGEDAWLGHVVRIGDARIRFRGHVGRCLVTSRDPESGVIDLPTLDIIRGYRHDIEATQPLPFGIYGEVVEPGRVRVGDPVALDGSRWFVPGGSCPVVRARRAPGTRPLGARRTAVDYCAVRMSPERVRIDVADHVATVTLTRADKHNALDLPMFEAIINTTERLAREPAVRAVVLHGEGPSFCSGLDVMAIMAAGNGIAGLTDRLEDRPPNWFQRAAYDWITVPAPVIAAVHGYCFGGGLQIALAADIRIAAADARLSVMEVKWGLVPDMSITRTLPRLVGIDVAKELTFTGRIISGAEAHALGLVTRLADDPLGAAHKLAAEIATRSPDAVRGAKRLYDRSWTEPPEQTLALEAEIQRGLIGSPNQLAAVAGGMSGQPAEFIDPV